MPQPKPTRRPATPAKPKALPPSPPWIPALMFSLLLIGVIIIVSNYFGLLPGGSNNSFLLIGIGQITVGFVVATMYR